MARALVHYRKWWFGGLVDAMAGQRLAARQSGTATFGRSTIRRRQDRRHHQPVNKLAFQCKLREAADVNYWLIELASLITRP